VILLASCFRDSTSYLERHRDQVERLRKLAQEPVYVIAVEGDSYDDTYERLKEMEYTDEVLKCEHGGQKYGSVVHPLRWRQLAACGNVAVCAAVRVSEPGDRFVYVESDLVWEPETILQMTEAVGWSYHAVAPMSMCQTEARFYDIWAFVKNGRPFHAHPPYYDGWHAAAHDLVPIETAGSCFVVDSETLPQIQFSYTECIKGIGQTLTAHGKHLWLDPTATVWHP